MIGLVVIGYDVLPEALLVALQCMVGKQKQNVAVPLSPYNEKIEKQRQVVLGAIEHVNSGEGVLAFTDSALSIAGHLSLSIYDRTDIELEIIKGVNLTMLSKVIVKRNVLPLEGLAILARDEGRKGIIWSRR